MQTAAKGAASFLAVAVFFTTAFTVVLPIPLAPFVDGYVDMAERPVVARI